MRKPAAFLLSIGLVVAGCSSDGSAEAPDGEVPATAIPLECETEGYPCELSEVPVEILERSHELSIEAADMFTAGADATEVDTWLTSHEDVVEVESDEEAVRFRVDGGRGTWVLRASAFGDRGAPSASTTGGAVAAAFGGPLFHVAGPKSDDKRALVLSPMLWDFAPLDEGAAVASLLEATKGYEGRVEFLANAAPEDTTVTVNSFRGWNAFQVVHVGTHGTTVCKEGSCRAVIAATTVRGELPQDEGVLPIGGKLQSLEGRGLDIGTVVGSRGFDLEEPLLLVLLTADFFRHEYKGGLQDTLVFFNACETLTGGATDLADAIRGTTSVFFGWNETVSSDAAVQVAEALYKDLGEGGYPADIAFDRLEGLRTDAFLPEHAQLQLADRADGDGLRIRDVVELLDPAAQLLDASSVIPITGEAGDGEFDDVPYAVQVDGVTPEVAGDAVLHVSIDGVEGDPQPLTAGSSNDKDQWTLTGSVPIGYDLEEDKVVPFRAWVELPDGGESDDETPATITGAEPIMGYVWAYEGTNTVGFPDHAPEVATATLTLEFEEGQAFDEPHPRYVVTGGTVTYQPISTSGSGCTYNDPGLTFTVTPEMSPADPEGDQAPSVLIFDTTVTPIEYRAVLYTHGPDDTVVQDCTAIDPTTYGVNTVNYGGNTTWAIVDMSDHRTVVDQGLIAEKLEPGSAYGYTIEFTITRIK
jgi:hypothetical protein